MVSRPDWTSPSKEKRSAASPARAAASPRPSASRKVRAVRSASSRSGSGLAGGGAAGAGAGGGGARGTVEAEVGVAVEVEVALRLGDVDVDGSNPASGAALRLLAVVVTPAGARAGAAAAGVTSRVTAGAGAAASVFASGAGVGAVAGAGVGLSGAAAACATSSAAITGRPFMGGGAYASFDPMASAPREAFGDLATTAFVESSILFRSVDEAARLDLLQVGEIQDFAPDEVVSGQDDERFLILRDGSAAVVADGPSGPVELYRLERGALFGVGRALGRPRIAWLQALSDVTVVSFPAPVVAVLAERFPKVRKLLEAVQGARDKEAAARLAS